MLEILEAKSCQREWQLAGWGSWRTDERRKWVFCVFPGDIRPRWLAVDELPFRFVRRQPQQSRYDYSSSINLNVALADRTTGHTAPASVTARARSASVNDERCR